MVAVCRAKQAIYRGRLEEVHEALDAIEAIILNEPAPNLRAPLLAGAVGLAAEARV